MAAPARYATPAAQMLSLARDARLSGLCFDEWWDAAVRPDKPPVTVSTPAERKAEFPGCVIWPSDSADRNLWRAATNDARDGWERAYYDLPATPAEAALKKLRPVLFAIQRGAERSPGLEAALAA